MLGVNLFRNTTVTTASSNAADPLLPVQSLVSPLFEMRLARHGIVATAQEVDGEFTVLKASLARASWIGVEDGYGRLRDKLVQDGTLVPTPDGKLATFARDQVFASPSAASAIVSGRNSNGRVEWKVKSTGLTYGAWQNQQIELTRGTK